MRRLLWLGAPVLIWLALWAVTRHIGRVWWLGYGDWLQVPFGRRFLAYATAHGALAGIAWLCYRYSRPLGVAVPAPAAAPRWFPAAIGAGGGILIAALATRVNLSAHALLTSWGVAVPPGGSIPIDRWPEYLRLTWILVTAPIFEELFYRRFLFGALVQRHGRAWGYIGVFVAFWLVHHWAAPGAGLVGVGLALLWELTGRLEAPILAHLVINLAAVSPGRPYTMALQVVCAAALIWAVLRMPEDYWGRGILARLRAPYSSLPPDAAA